MFDSLDTLWIMGLPEYFDEAIQVISETNFTKEVRAFSGCPLLHSQDDANLKDLFVPFFETVIRYLGGLLSAFALSGEPVLLTRADELGQALLSALNTSSGFPMYAVNPKT